MWKFTEQWFSYQQVSFKCLWELVGIPFLASTKRFITWVGSNLYILSTNRPSHFLIFSNSPSTRTQIQPCTPTHSHLNTQTHTPAHTRTYTHLHLYTHPWTHTHTHTRVSFKVIENFAQKKRIAWHFKRRKLVEVFLKNRLSPFFEKPNFVATQFRFR